jgi:hypothetical protein
MTPQDARDTYRSMMDERGEIVLIRRYLGSGQNRPKFEVSVRARIFDYTPVELIGGIIQGDVKVICLYEDLVNGQYNLPILKNDKVVVGGKELNIESPDRHTRKIAGELIAYELQARG